ncbi:MAG: hypothetical protein KGM44_09485 [bacterium]|nr:hypothetical protein [bacterium]
MLQATRTGLSVGKALVALFIIAALTLGVLTPSLAETAGQRSTRNIILGAAALTAGIIIYNNIHHKQLAHNTVVGYTRNGGTVYADGRVVYPNGTSYYLSNDGRNTCGYDGDEEPCGQYARAYAWHDNGFHRGWYKQHRHHGENDDGWQQQNGQNGQNGQNEDGDYNHSHDRENRQ